MKNNFFIKWVLSRLTERTTLDGVVLVVAGLSFFLLKPIASLMAVIAIIYGIWTILQSEF